MIVPSLLRLTRWVKRVCEERKRVDLESRSHYLRCDAAAHRAASDYQPPCRLRSDLLRDVEGFDSLNALEVVVQVSDDLGMEIPETILNPAKEPRTLTIGTLVDRILAHVEDTANGKETNGDERHR